MDNTTSSMQAQQRVTQLQKQRQGEFSALSSELLELGANAMQAEKESRARGVLISILVGVVLAFIMAVLPYWVLPIGWKWFLGIVWIGGGVGIAYAVRFSPADKITLNKAIETLNDAVKPKTNNQPSKW